VVNLGDHDVAKHALFDVLVRFLVGIVGHPLHANLHFEPGLLDARDNLFRLFDRFGHRLLTIDVLAGGERVHDHLVVPVLGGGDQNIVDVFVIEQLTVLFVRFSAGELRRLVAPLVVDVGDRDDLDVVGVFHPVERVHVAGSHAAGSNHADAHALISAENTRVSGGSDKAGRADKLSSGNHAHGLHLSSGTGGSFYSSETSICSSALFGRP